MNILHDTFLLIFRSISKKAARRLTLSLEPIPGVKSESISSCCNKWRGDGRKGDSARRPVIVSVDLVVVAPWAGIEWSYSKKFVSKLTTAPSPKSLKQKVGPWKSSATYAELSFRIGTAWLGSSKPSSVVAQIPRSTTSATSSLPQWTSEESQTTNQDKKA